MPYLRFKALPPNIRNCKDFIHKIFFLHAIDSHLGSCRHYSQFAKEEIIICKRQN